MEIKNTKPSNVPSQVLGHGVSGERGPTLAVVHTPHPGVDVGGVVRKTGWGAVGGGVDPAGLDTQVHAQAVHNVIAALVGHLGEQEYGTFSWSNIQYFPFARETLITPVQNESVKKHVNTNNIPAISISWSYAHVSLSVSFQKKLTLQP